jgi:hypothetical protein
MFKVSLAILAACLAVPAVAAPDAGSQSSQPDKPKKEKKICKRVASTESRVSTSVCKTAEEWEKDPTTGDGSRSSISGRPSGY